MIDRFMSSVNIATDDVYGDGITVWYGSSVSDLMTVQDRSIMSIPSNSKLCILTNEIFSSRWGIGL